MKSTVVILLALFFVLTCMTLGQDKVRPEKFEGVRIEEGHVRPDCFANVQVPITTATNLNVDLSPWLVEVTTDCGVKWEVTWYGIPIAACIKLDHPGHFVGSNPACGVDPYTGPIRVTAPLHTAFGYSIEFVVPVISPIGNVVYANVVIDPEYERR